MERGRCPVQGRHGIQTKDSLICRNKHQVRENGFRKLFYPPSRKNKVVVTSFCLGC
jgi:hypothetical protein